MPSAVDRLQRFLLIALQSEQPGEVVAAVEMARKEIQKHKLDAHDLANRLAGIQPRRDRGMCRQGGHDYATDPDVDADVDVAKLALWALEKHRARMRPNEIQFMESMCGWTGDPTERQASWMASIVMRLRRGG